MPKVHLQVAADPLPSHRDIFALPAGKREYLYALHEGVAE